MEMDCTGLSPQHSKLLICCYIINACLQNVPQMYSLNRSNEIKYLLTLNAQNCVYICVLPIN